MTVGLVTGIGLIATFGWQLWFELFHRFYFQSGSWLFDYSDTLIRLIPVQFWFDITLAISAINLIEAVLLAFLGWRWKVTLLEDRAEITRTHSPPFAHFPAEQAGRTIALGSDWGG